MTPGNLPLPIYRGDSYGWRFVLWKDPEKTLAVDLTDASAKAEIRTAPGGKLLAAIDTYVELPNIVVASLSAAKTATLTAAGGSWDLQLTYAANGEVQTVLAGKVTVTLDVTEAAAP